MLQKGLYLLLPLTQAEANKFGVDCLRFFFATDRQKITKKVKLIFAEKVAKITGRTPTEAKTSCENMQIRKANINNGLLTFAQFGGCYCENIIIWEA